MEIEGSEHIQVEGRATGPSPRFDVGEIGKEKIKNDYQITRLSNRLNISQQVRLGRNRF